MNGRFKTKRQTCVREREREKRREVVILLPHLLTVLFEYIANLPKTRKLI